MTSDEWVWNMIARGQLTVDFETGNVYSRKSNSPSKSLGAKTAKGYLRTCINHHGQRFNAMIHRIVWIAAHGIPDPKFQIDHKNGIKNDNRLVNLDLVSGDTNMKRASAKGLTKGGWKNAPRDAKGRFVGKKAAGRVLDGKTWDESPLANTGGCPGPYGDEYPDVE